MSEVRAMKRPLYVVGLSFATSLFLASRIGFHLSCIAAALGALLFVVVLAVESLRRSANALAALSAAVAAFCLFAAWEYTTVQPLQRRHGEDVSVTVFLEDTATVTDTATAYYARVKAGDLPVDTRMILWVTDGEDVPALYYRATATVRVHADDGWRREGIYLSAYWNEGTVTVSNERPWDHWLQQWRQRVLNGLEAKADGEVAALLRAICFGDTSRMTSDMREAFAASGLSHVTAVSGFHMSTITLGMFGLLCLLRIKRRWAACVALPVPLIFAALTGFSSSALRAGVMCGLVMLAAVFRRQADGRNSLGGAVLLLLMGDIPAIYDLGLLLSVAATWGILVALDWFPPRAGRRWNTVKTGVSVSVAAAVATLPLTAWYFGEVSVVSPLTNVLASPLVSVIVITGCVGAMLIYCAPLYGLAWPFVLVAGVAARALGALASAAASLPIALLRLDRWYLIVLAVAAPFALILGWRLRKGRGVRLAAVLLVVAFCASTLTFRIGMRGVTTVTTTDVSGGTAVLFTRDGHHGLILLGEPNREEVQLFLQERVIDQLDLVLTTQGHNAYCDTSVDVQAFLDVVSSGEPLRDGARITFWENTSARYVNGCWRVSWNTAAVLLIPKEANVAALPEDVRMATLAVFDRAFPDDVDGVAWEHAVVSCKENAMPPVVWGAYPVEVTDGTVVTVNIR